MSTLRTKVNRTKNLRHLHTVLAQASYDEIATFETWDLPVFSDDPTSLPGASHTFCANVYSWDDTHVLVLECEEWKICERQDFKGRLNRARNIVELCLVLNGAATSEKNFIRTGGYTVQNFGGSAPSGGKLCVYSWDTNYMLVWKSSRDRFEIQARTDAAPKVVELDTADVPCPTTSQ